MVNILHILLWCLVLTCPAQGQVIKHISGGAPPAGWTQVASDDFNRADLSDLGEDWSQITNESNFIISSNRAMVNNTGRRGEYYSAYIPNDNQCSEATIVSPGSISGVTLSLFVRASDSAESGYTGGFDGTNWHIKKLVTGTFTTLDSAAGTGTNGDVIKFCAEGTTLTVYKNNVEMKSTTDSTFSSGYFGMFTYSESGYGFDDWKGYEK